LQAAFREDWRMALVVSLLILWFASHASTNAATAGIKVDQVGYQPSAPKLAMVAGGRGRFIVRRASDDKAMF
jgi:Cellulase N-terminal ig-like domain